METVLQQPVIDFGEFHTFSSEYNNSIKWRTQYFIFGVYI